MEHYITLRPTEYKKLLWYNKKRFLFFIKSPAWEYSLSPVPRRACARYCAVGQSRSPTRSH